MVILHWYAVIALCFGLFVLGITIGAGAQQRRPAPDIISPSVSGASFLLLLTLLWPVVAFAFIKSVICDLFRKK